MKKALKVIAGVVGVLALVFVIAVLLFIKNLPSTWEIKQAISPKKAQNPEFAQKASPPSDNKTPVAKNAPPPAHDDKVDESKARSLRVLKENFMDEQKPLSSVCAHLVSAEQSKFLRKDDSGSAEEFTKRLDDNDRKDPLVESAAPVFRYLFRLDGVKGLVDMVEEADAEHDEGLLKKTEFYTKLAMAGQTMRSNKANFDRILMKGYNLYILSRVVGKHPELARDSATLSFCDQIEKNINMNLDFNADEQAKEMQKFLDYAKVDPKEVDYDPNYRSDVKFSFSDKALAMNHIWIEKLFAKDIEKAKKELKEVPSESPETSTH